MKDGDDALLQSFYLQGLNDHTAPIGGMRSAAYVTGLLQTVDNSGDGAGGESRQFGETAGGRGPVLVEQSQTLPFRSAHSQVSRHGFVEKDYCVTEFAAHQILTRRRRGVRS